MTKEALQAQISGETLYTETVGLNTEWTNFSDGRVVGQIHSTSDNRGWYGSGTWHISDDGKYCVDITWQNYPDAHWCRSVYKVGNRLYIPERDSSDAIPVEYSMAP